MSLTVRILVNGGLIEAFDATNRGTPDGTPPVDHDGERVYTWKRRKGDRTGVVVHRRDAGAIRLAIAVLEDALRETERLQLDVKRVDVDTLDVDHR